MAGKADLLKRFLRPEGIAVVGASESPTSLGTRYMRGLLRHGYEGDVYPVNPKYDSLYGLKTYATIGEIDGEPDCAVLSVRAAEVEEALRQCAAKGIAGAVVFAGGYSEMDAAGADAEERLGELAAELGIRVLGPNSPGYVNFLDKVTILASSVVYRPPWRTGELGLVSQGGGPAGIVIEKANDRGLGLTYAICLGNEADIDAVEAIDFLIEDEDTKTIGVYQEAIVDGERVVGAWERALAAGKPVVVYKAGGSPTSEQASLAHTGSMLGDDDVFSGLARQLGVHRAGSLDELFEIATALPKLPERRYRTAAIVTNSGGGSVLAADAIGKVGITLPQLGESLRAQLRERLMHDFAPTKNPIDFTSDLIQKPQVFEDVIEVVCQSPDHDIVVLVQTVQRTEFGERLAQTVVASPEARERKLVVMWHAGEMTRGAREILRDAGVVVFETPAHLARGLEAARRWHRRRPAGERLEPAAASARPPDAVAAFEVLAGHEVPVAPFARLDGDGGAALGAVPAPWVLKAAALDLGRKSDVGGVALGLEDEEEALAASERMRADLAAAGAEPGVMVQSQVPIAYELLLSVRRDPVFGTVVVLGPGGRLTELDGRIAVRRPRLSGEDVRDMLDELGLEKLLDGFRDIPAVDPDRLATVANDLAAAATALVDSGGTVEVNPLAVARGSGELVALDVKVEEGGR